MFVGLFFMRARGKKSASSAAYRAPPERYFPI
jgi:hypothetical protein